MNDNTVGDALFNIYDRTCFLCDDALYALTLVTSVNFLVNDNTVGHLAAVSSQNGSFSLNKHQVFQQRWRSVMELGL